jgi:hypothetical protein
VHQHHRCRRTTCHHELSPIARSVPGSAIDIRSYTHNNARAADGSRGRAFRQRTGGGGPVAMPKRQMHLVAYSKTGPTARHVGGWRHPESVLDDFLKPSRYAQYARTLEDARFDGWLRSRPRLRRPLGRGDLHRPAQPRRTAGVLRRHQGSHGALRPAAGGLRHPGGQHPSSSARPNRSRANGRSICGA